MPLFTVTLRKEDNPLSVKKVTVEAPSSSASLISAAERGWRATGAVRAEGNARVRSNATQMKGKDLIRFCKAMASQLKAGIQLMNALVFFGKRLKNPRIKSALAGVVDDLKNGESSKVAFERSGLFDSVFVGIVAAGEHAGNMTGAFAGIAKFNAIRVEATTKIKKAILTPLVTAIFVLGLFVAAMTNLTPNIEKLLTDMKQTPDPFSGFVFWVSHVVRAGWIPATLLVIAATIFLFYAASVRTSILNIAMSRWALLRAMIMSYRQLLFLSTFHMLIENGVEVPPALETCSVVMSGTVMAQELVTVRKKYDIGVSLAVALEQYSSCDEEISHLIGVGEETSTTKDQVGMLVSLFEERLTESIESFSNIVKIVMIVSAAILLGSCYLSSYLPIILMGPKMMQSAM